MTEAYHTTSIFQSTDAASREQFNNRITLMGTRLERFVKGCLWRYTRDADDRDDAFQGGLLRLWKLYQAEPQIMDLDEHWWLRKALRYAEYTLKEMQAQRGISHSSWIEQMEYNASSLRSATTDEDGLERMERRHARHSVGRKHPESDQVDQHIDLERLLNTALEQVAAHHRQAVRDLLPFIANELTVRDAARCCGIGRGKAEDAWTAFQKTIEQITGLPTKTAKGKGVLADTDEEYAIIRELAAKGLSVAKIAEQMHRSEKFVSRHFERATGYRRGRPADNHPVTPEMVVQIRTLRAQGMTYRQIAKTVGCGTYSVGRWLSAK